MQDQASRIMPARQSEELSESPSPHDAPELAHANGSRGLTSAQVEALRLAHGLNEIPEKEESLISRVLRRFWGPIPWMIEVAAILSAVVQKWEDFVIIMILLLVNVAIDFRQEAKALGALKLLKQKLARRALTLRDGKWREIPAQHLVPGDVVKLRIGNIIPADVKLLEGAYLQLDQSALTGESLPVDRAPGDIGYANAVVKKGEMIALVTETGPNTYFGRTVALVAKAEREQRSHFQKAVMRVGNFLILFAAAMVVIIIITALFRHDPLMEILRFSLVLTIASIPVAMPAVLSVTMAVGAVRLAQRKAIVSRLVAIEELAGVDVLCCDKTGTLTQNRMELGEPTTFSDFDGLAVIRFAAMASREEDQDPLEAPIFEALKKTAEPTAEKRRPTRFLPFDPVSKRTEASYDDGLVITKGAPQAILALCPDERATAEISERVQQLAQKGDRALGVAVKRPGDAAFQFAGLLPFFDPPREDSAQMIEQVHTLGVDIKMVTGDNLAIASQIAHVLGLNGAIRDISDLKKQKSPALAPIAEAITDSLYAKLKPDAEPSEVAAARSDVIQRLESKLETLGPDLQPIRRHESEIIELIESSAGFAQVFPEDKYLIVDRLQRADRIVGMTGDGVNDAPALRKADAGIAVSGATDAARASADVILLNPGMGVIVEAIRESRRIFARMQSYAIFRIAETLRVILFMTLAITVFNFYPVTAIMIIILALLNDIPIMAIAYDNVRADEEPVRWDMKEVLTVATALGLLGVTASFLLFFIVESMGLPMKMIQALMFLKLSVAGHTTIYVARCRDAPFWRRPFPSWRLVVPLTCTQIVATLAACYGVFMSPIGWRYAIYIWMYAIIWFTINDFVKVQVYHFLRNRKWLLASQMHPSPLA